MSRIIEVSLPNRDSDRLMPRIKELEGLIGLRVQKNISIKPPGDVLAVELVNSSVTPFLNLLEEEGLLFNDQVSISTSEPKSVISKSSSELILKESHETSWEESLKGLLHESNMTINSQLLMMLSGLIAAIGICTNSIHVVVGAMVIAPGFEPISRLSLGLVTSHRDWKNAGMDILKGYGALIVGGFVGAAIFTFLGKDLIPGTSTYLPEGSLIKYWTSVTAPSIIVSIIAAVAGGLVIISNKSVLTAGVMIALALIPTASLLGICILDGNFALAANAGTRLIIDMIIVAVFSGLVFLVKRKTSQKRNMQA